MAKKNSYWQDRAEQLAIARDKENADLIDDIKLSLDQSQNEITEKIEYWYQKIADNTGVSLADAKRLLNNDELGAFKWDVKQYIKIAENEQLRDALQVDLVNASARAHIDRLTALETHLRFNTERVMKRYESALTKQIDKQYKDNFYKSVFADQVRRSKFDIVPAINQNTLDNLIAKPWTPDGKTFSKRLWQRQDELTAKVHKELTVMCVNGDGPDRAIKEIAKEFNATKVQAGRIVMTESAYFSAESNKKVYNDLGVDEYEIVATLDSHTSEICQELDTKVFDYKDYEAGVTAPPFHVWCRSTTCPYFDDEFTDNEKRIARDENGKNYYVDSNKSYKEWQNEYVKSDIDASKTDVKKPTWNDQDVPNRSAEVIEEIDFVENADNKVYNELKGDEINEFFNSQESHQNWIAGLDEKSKIAIEHYTMSDHTPMNEILRHGKDKYIADSLKFYNNDLNELSVVENRANEIIEKNNTLIKSLDGYKAEKSFKVYRRTKDNNAGYYLNLKVGDVQSLDKGFLSTSLDIEQTNGFINDGYGRSYLFDITVKRGSNSGAFIADLSDMPEEKEFLFKPNTEFKVLGIKEADDGITVVELETLQ